MYWVSFFSCLGYVFDDAEVGLFDLVLVLIYLGAQVRLHVHPYSDKLLLRDAAVRRLLEVAQQLRHNRAVERPALLVNLRSYDRGGTAARRDEAILLR